MSTVVKTNGRRGYRLLTKDELMKLPFHNLRRLMVKVRSVFIHYNDWEKETEADIIEPHKKYYETLKEVAGNHPHKPNGLKGKK